MEKQKVIYIAGPITGVKNYWEPFEQVEEILTELGYIAITPTRLPKGMTTAQYMKICFAMIDAADAVVFLPDWANSEGARLEAEYCRYTEKPAVVLATSDRINGLWPKKVVSAWAEAQLKEVFGNE